MASGLGSLSDYVQSLGTQTADVGGGSALGSILGQAGGGLGGIGSVLNLGQGISDLMQGGVSNDISGASDLASIAALAIPGVGEILSPLLAIGGNLLGSLITPGLPANAKPDMYAQYLQQQGGLPSDLGSLIAAAQNKAGSGSGILSQSGAGAFNPNFMATLLEALTGQNLGTVDPSTGRQTFTAPATGQVKNPVSLSFLGENQLMSSPGMQGLTAYGYTPQQLSTPQALKAIEQATSYGDVGTGQGLGTQKVAQYLPKVVQALQAAGIQPGAGSTSAAPVGNENDYLNQPTQPDTSNKDNTGTGNDLTIPLSTLLSLGTTGTNLANLLNSGTISGSNITLPTSALSKVLSNQSPTSTPSTPSVTPPSASFRQGWSSIGMPRPFNLPTQNWNPLGGATTPMPTAAPTQVITPQMDMSAVSGGQQQAPQGGGGGSIAQALASLLGGGSTGTPAPTSLSGISPWTVAAA